RARAAAQGPSGEGEPDSVQPVPGDALRALERRGDRTVPPDTQQQRRDRDDAAHPRRRHRRRLRPAGRPGQRPHDRTPRLQAHLSGGATVKRAATIVTRGLVILAIFFGGCTNSNNVTTPKPERAAEINLELGIEHLRKGNLQQAKDKIDRALEQNPRYGRAHLVAGMLYNRLGDQSKAESHFERAVSLEPKNPEFKNNYAVYLCQ